MMIKDAKLLLISLILNKPVSGFVAQSATSGPSTSMNLITQSTKCSKARLWKGRKDNDEDDQLQPGMLDAFKQLDSLGSLDDNTSIDTPSNKISADKSSLPVEEDAKISPEKEVQMYSKMMQDLESTDEEDLYSDLMAEMGGEPKTSSPPLVSQSNDGDNMPVSPSKEEMGKFMDDALNEALDEVQLKSSDKLSADSILNDKEIMKEIEAIFDRGSEELMQSLEEIRQEQQSFAQESAEASAQDAADISAETAERLASAEASMAAMLNRVSKEAEEVEKAAQDLRNAQAELDKDFVVKLRNGGLPKQVSLVGFLLFSVRSIGDTVASFSDESLLAGALLQGGIAVVCAAIFFLL